MGTVGPQGAKEQAMLDTILKHKRQIMGWVGVAAVVVALFPFTELLPYWEKPTEPELKLVLVMLGAALICLAMPRSIWPKFRTWWTSD